MEKNLEKRRFARGGSTITQQLAKNLYFGTEKSPTRKLRELIVTRWIEDDLTKRRILELYLNVIEWGDGLYGAEAAARRYYGKAASDVDANEAAGLAAMIPNPRRINPAGQPGAARPGAEARPLADGGRGLPGADRGGPRERAAAARAAGRGRGRVRGTSSRDRASAGPGRPRPPALAPSPAPTPSPTPTPPDESR